MIDTLAAQRRRNLTMLVLALKYARDSRIGSPTTRQRIIDALQSTEVDLKKELVEAKLLARKKLAKRS